MSEFKETLSTLISKACIAIADDTIAKCEQYFRLIKQTNAHTNLTRITDEAQAAQMHFFSAIALLKCLDLPQGCSVIDIGTGAGFPGIPIKFARPDIRLTLLDSSGKKTAFIQSAAEQMAVDVTVLNERAEETAHTFLRESFDVCVSRAVAALPVLLELCLPFVKTGGTFAAWKGEKHEGELTEAKNALGQLGGALRNIQQTEYGAILLIEKKKPTPGSFPRRFSKIKSTPL